MVSGLTVGTCINISNVVNTITNETIYFRTHFNYTGPASAVLRLDACLDDSVVLYLNGAEYRRVRMPTGPVNYFTQGAGGAIGDGSFAESFVVPTSGLISGDNLLAAELHTIGNNSSDRTFGLKIEELVSSPPLIVTISYDAIGATVTVSWSGGSSAGTLRSTTNITTARPWPAVQGAVSPYSTANTGPQRFYEVSDP